MQTTPEHVLALREKYREIQRLRAERARNPEHDAKAALRELAQRFPGALRELDELPPAALERRLIELDALLDGALPAPEWVSLQIAYHGFLRAALRIKRVAVAAGRRDDPARVLAELPAHYRPRSDEPPLASFDHGAICMILRPDGGRLNPWIFAQVAAVHGVDSERVRRALYTR